MKKEEFKTLRIFIDGRNYKTTFTKKFEERKPWVRPNPEEIKTFIPGLVQKILVTEGQTVKTGDKLILFVAMKMHNVIRAPFDGTVTGIHVNVGDTLPRGAVMMNIKKVIPDAKKKRNKLGSPK
jgi:biotin carboxyl carrier protein